MDKDILKLSPIKGTDLYVLMNQMSNSQRL